MVLFSLLSLLLLLFRLTDPSSVSGVGSAYVSNCKLKSKYLNLSKPHLLGCQKRSITSLAQIRTGIGPGSPFPQSSLGLSPSHPEMRGTHRINAAITVTLFWPDLGFDTSVFSDQDFTAELSSPQFPGPAIRKLLLQGSKMQHSCWGLELAGAAGTKRL